MTKGQENVAIIRAPGGLPGIEAHVGATLALEEAGISSPVWVSGASAGAVVSALQAAGMSGTQMYDTLMGLDTWDVIRHRAFWRARLFWLESICDPDPISALLSEHLPMCWDDLQIPLSVSATHMDFGGADGKTFDRADGVDLRQAVQASMAIAGIFPYVDVQTVRRYSDGSVRHGASLGLYSDGGTTDPVPCPGEALWDAVDRVIVVLVSRAERPRRRDRNVVSRLLWNVEQLLADSRFDGVHRIRFQHQHVRVTQLHLYIGDVSCLEFSSRHDLVLDAYHQTLKQLEAADAPF